MPILGGLKKRWEEKKEEREDTKQFKKDLEANIKTKVREAYATTYAEERVAAAEAKAKKDATPKPGIAQRLAGMGGSGGLTGTLGSVGRMIPTPEQMYGDLGHHAPSPQNLFQFNVGAQAASQPARAAGGGRKKGKGKKRQAAPARPALPDGLSIFDDLKG